MKIKDSTGFIEWIRGTGDNVELTNIRTYRKGHGHGRELFYQMLRRLGIYHPPFYSVYGFTRVSNSEAQAFYAALGFEIQEIHGVYKDGRAVLFWQDYVVLVERMNVSC